MERYRKTKHFWTFCRYDHSIRFENQIYSACTIVCKGLLTMCLTKAINLYALLGKLSIPHSTPCILSHQGAGLITQSLNESIIYISLKFLRPRSGKIIITYTYLIIITYTYLSYVNYIYIHVHIHTCHYMYSQFHLIRPRLICHQGCG